MQSENNLDLNKLKEFILSYKGGFADNINKIQNSVFKYCQRLVTYNNNIYKVVDIKINKKLIKNKILLECIKESWQNKNTMLDCTMFRAYLRWYLYFTLSLDFNKSENKQENKQENKEIYNQIVSENNNKLLLFPFNKGEYNTKNIMEVYWLCPEACNLVITKDLPELPALHTIYIPSIGWIFLNQNGVNIGPLKNVKDHIINYCTKNNIWQNNYTIITNEVIPWSV